MKAKCSESVWRGPVLFSPCERFAVAERGGKLYCRQHDPEEVKRRDEAKRQKWKQEREASAAQAERIRAARVARDCIIQIAYGLQQHDKRLARAFTMLMENSDWQPPAPAVGADK